MDHGPQAVRRVGHGGALDGPRFEPCFQPGLGQLATAVLAGLAEIQCQLPQGRSTRCTSAAEGGNSPSANMRSDVIRLNMYLV